MKDSIAELDEFELGDSFQALRRGISRARGFAVYLCVCNSLDSRKKIIENLFATLPGTTGATIDIGNAGDDLLAYLTNSKNKCSDGPAMIVGLDRLFDNRPHAERWLGNLNLSRGEWPVRLPQPVVFWIQKKWLGELIASAPDFFDWRSDTIEFPEISKRQTLILGTREWHHGVDPRLDANDQTMRKVELTARIHASTHSSHPKDTEARLGWWNELADLAVVSGEIDEALRIRTEEQLPVYERLGEVRSIAITKGQIADILQARGDLDEAIRIKEADELPILEMLADKRTLMIARSNLLQLYWQRNCGDDKIKAVSLLDQSVQAAIEMRLPTETGQLIRLSGALSVDLGELLERIELEASSKLFLEHLIGEMQN